ncbi:RICIN domain-containing protein [Ferruginibacter sp. HRS2-29]|uniref:RICIN domain-containing protein n=1 Tax=Ferruginibacter sp. HRS2-29 TaxID=2487334 RepID=UPI0020CE90AF|nr:RICIN domain-containing protein [Ferruginibacter sp. HRS2-29]MCP9751808.1 hypothetical protein [Ferruginibacter sp. HRS2-29]
MSKIIIWFCCLCMASSVHAQSLTDGEYFIKVNQTGKYMAIAGAATNNGAWLIQWDNEYKAHFKFMLKSLGNNIYSIRSSHSGRYISTEGNAVRGAKIIQWDWLNQDNQKWRIEKTATGYSITCVQNGQRIYLSGANAATATPANGSYFICNSDDKAMNFSFLKNETGQELIKTRPGNKLTKVNNGTPVIAGQVTVDIPDGIYKIRINESGKYLAIAGEEDLRNGMRLIQWDMLPRNNHLFELKRMDNGNYTIKAIHSEKVLDVVDRQTADGTQVQQWDDLQGNNQQWKIYGTANNYKIVSAASNKGLQLSSGPANNNNGTALVITGSNTQTFSLLPARANKFTEYISITNLQFTVPHGGDLDIFGKIQVFVTDRYGNSYNRYYDGTDELFGLPESRPLDMDKLRTFFSTAKLHFKMRSDELLGAKITIVYGINENDGDVASPFSPFGIAGFPVSSDPNAKRYVNTDPYKAGGNDDYYLLKHSFNDCLKSDLLVTYKNNCQSFYITDIPKECNVHVNLQDEDGSDNWLDILFTITKERK